MVGADSSRAGPRCDAGALADWVCRDFGPALTSTARVVFSVLDTSDNEPESVQTSYADELIENNCVGAFMPQVNVTDRDHGRRGA